MNKLEECLNRYYESLLIEDIEAVRKQYPNIAPNNFDSIIRMDPTFKEDRDSVGTYGKWLLNLYKKINGQYPSNIRDLLQTYDTYKNDRHKEINKDINSFKSISELESAIKNVGEKQITDRQATRERKTSKDYDMVYENDNWAIFVPRSWEGDVALGKGTKWCTAADSEQGKEMYDKYLSQGGKYYVIINKNNKAEKYQFQFEASAFRDEDDHGIENIARFCDKNGLSDFFKNEGYNIYIVQNAIDYDFTKDEIAELVLKHSGLNSNQHVDVAISIDDLRMAIIKMLSKGIKNFNTADTSFKNEFANCIISLMIDDNFDIYINKLNDLCKQIGISPKHKLFWEDLGERCIQTLVRPFDFGGNDFKDNKIILLDVTVESIINLCNYLINDGGITLTELTTALDSKDFGKIDILKFMRSNLWVEQLT